MANETQDGGLRPVLPHFDMAGNPEPGFENDPNLPDHSADILSAFGFGDDAGDQGGSTLPSGAEGGGAPPPPAPAAEGGAAGAQSPAPQSTSPQPDAGATQQPQVSPQQQAAPGTGPAPAPAAGGDSSELQTLRAQVQALTQTLQTLQQGQGQQGGGQQPQTSPSGTQPEGVPTPEQLQEYGFTLPRDVTDALFGDDPARATQAMTHLVNSFGKIVHQRVVAHVDQLINQRVGTAILQSSQSAEQARMQQEYYASFKDHNDPATRLIVAQEAQQMWTEQPNLQWGPDAINALGARVNAKLGRSTTQATPTPPAPPPPSPAPRPAPQMGGGTRHGIQPGQAQEAGDFIHDILTA